MALLRTALLAACGVWRLPAQDSGVSPQELFSECIAALAAGESMVDFAEERNRRDHAGDHDAVEVHAEDEDDDHDDDHAHAEDEDNGHDDDHDAERGDNDAVQGHVESSAEHEHRRERESERRRVRREQHMHVAVNMTGQHRGHEHDAANSTHHNVSDREWTEHHFEDGLNSTERSMWRGRHWMNSSGLAEHLSTNHNISDASRAFLEELMPVLTTADANFLAVFSDLMSANGVSVQTNATVQDLHADVNFCMIRMTLSEMNASDDLALEEMDDAFLLEDNETLAMAAFSDDAEASGTWGPRFGVPLLLAWLVHALYSQK